jgi:hypothetical protein
MTEIEKSEDFSIRKPLSQQQEQKSQELEIPSM